MDYALRYKNYALHPRGTDFLHYKVFSEKGKVIWGQWTSGVNKLSESRFEIMNEEPFTLYAFDKNSALIEMKVSRVLRAEEITDELAKLIPEYYRHKRDSISAFYLVDEMIVRPVSAIEGIYNVNTGTCLIQANQINSNAPWGVKEEEPKERKEDEISNRLLETDISKYLEEDILEDNSHSVYKYTHKESGKVYVGQTNNLSRRKREHESKTTWKRHKKKYLYIMFAMYGVDSFDYQVLHSELSKEDADIGEAFEIKKHNAYFPNGLNERDESRHLKKLMK